MLTAEQTAAIHTRDVSIALSAGAGCGKTFVLTKRFISHLTPEATAADPARLGQLIAITFTDAAAREMRARIRQACYDELATAKSEDEEQHWQRLLREIDSARVSTIHSFCTSLLRANASAAGLDPLFGVLGQSEADVLQLEVIDDVLRRELSVLDSETLTLASAYGLSRLKQQITSLIGHRHADAFSRWLDATPAEVVARWRTWHSEFAFPMAVREIAATEAVTELQSLLRDVTPDAKKPQFIAAKATLLELLPRLEQGDVSRSDLQAIVEVAKVQGICTAKDWGAKEQYDAYRDACAELRKVIDKHLPKEFSEEAALVTAELGLALLRLTNKVVEEYERRKVEEGKLDFDDLLFKTYRMLTDPKNAELRKQVADELRLLLVDEFQDTDQLQSDLVKVLCGEGFDVGRLFFVGDFKQSIYRFRGAEPTVFRELQSSIHEKGRLPLTLNFRSQPGVLDFVNALFCDALRIEGEDYQPLHAHRPQRTELPCVEFLWTITPDKKPSVAGSMRAARREEAQAIARRLRGLLDGRNGVLPVVDKQTGEPRALELGDIAILFRALPDIEVYEEALRELELDYYLVGGHAFYAQQEIFDVLNLLRSVASTADEVSLAGVLRSPFFALADESLFWLRDSGPSLNVGLFAKKLPKQLSPEEHAKVVAAADTIGHLRRVKDRIPIATLLGQALDRTGYDAVLLTEFLGQRKLANLHKLMERARAADSGGVLDLDGFITQLSQLIAQEPKEAFAATLPEAANVIRLMTIHHAKGLEFPLVVLPDLDRRPHVATAPAVLHAQLGPLVAPPGDDEQQQETATGMSLYAALDRIEELEERKRLLYVACTRAADYLILSSSLEAYDKTVSDWMRLISERFDLNDGHLLATLPDDYEPPQVRVEADRGTDHKPVGKSRGPDLLKLLEEAHQIATDDQAIIPSEVAPIPVDQTARRQFSFSRLTGRLVRPRTEARSASGGLLPSNAEVAVLDGRSLGTLAHEVLARIDFDAPASIAEWCEHLASQLVLQDTQRACETASELVTRFAGSARGKQLAQAAAVHREVEFLLAWPAVSSQAEGVHFRGFIDCLYQSADGAWHLIDYKTDNITAAEVPRAAKRYAMQLYVYAMAAEQALGEAPSELVLHFLRPGVEHVFTWDAAARREAVAMVNAAIASFYATPVPSDELIGSAAD